MSMEKGYPIEITHYINPHLFWFKSKEESVRNDVQLAEIERKMHLMFAQDGKLHNHVEVKFDINDVVAVKYLRLGKYIRAKILRQHIMHKDECMLWAMDYGFPIQTEKKYIKLLPEDLCKHSSIIRRGGLNDIMPSKTTTEFNFADSIPLNEWSKEACDCLKDLIIKSSTINFIENWKSPNDHHWGDLLISFESHKINVHKYLLNDYGVSVNLRKYTHLDTTNISSWLTNSLEMNAQKNELTSEKNECNCVNETAAGKVKDWQAKNAIQSNCASSNSSICSMDKTNDGSVSEICQSHGEGGIVCYPDDFIQQRNYICKGAALIKNINEQLKVSGTPKWPGDGHFEIRGVHAIDDKSEVSNMSNKPFIATRLQQLAKIREKFITDKKNKIPSSGAPIASSVSSVSTRTAKLIALREQQMSKHTVEIARTSTVDNESNKDEEMRSTLSAATNADILIRTKQLITMRRKLSNKTSAYSSLTENEPHTSQKDMLHDYSGNSNEDDISTETNFKRLGSNMIIQVRELPNDYKEVIGNQNEMKIVEKEAGVHAFAKSNKLSNETYVSVPPQITKTVTEADFLSLELRATMQTLGIKDLFPMQDSSWRHICKGSSAFVVDNKSSGKTWSYLPSICNAVIDTACRIKVHFGPISVIIVADEEQVCRISALCSTLLKSHLTQPKVAPFYGERNLVKTKVALLNGCAILVTTYTNFLNLLDLSQNEPLFDKKSLRHVVVDDLDVITETAGIPEREIFQKISKVCDICKTSKMQAQCVVTSTVCYEVIDSLRRQISGSLLLIGDPLKAAVYIGTKLKIIPNSCKFLLESLLHIIRGIESIEKTVIVCNTNEEVNEIKDHIECLCKYSCIRMCSEFFSDRQLIDEIVKNQKHPKSKVIIISTDDRLQDIHKSDVKTLIHFGMPKSWTAFSQRFKIFFQSHENSFNNFGEQSKDLPIGKFDTESFILVATDHNADNILALRDFMKRHDKFIDSKLEKIARTLLARREEYGNSEGIPLCPNLLEFGKCNLVTCNDRHTLNNFDIASTENDMPLNGHICVHVLQVFSPIHFACRLLAHKSENAKQYSVVRRSTENLKFIMQFNIHYGSLSDPIVHSPLRIRDICVYKHLGAFVRARILNLLSSTDFNFTCKKHINASAEEVQITLKLIDHGAVIYNVKPYEVFVCDKQFKDFPAQAVDIRLHGIVPKDNESIWSSKITKLVEDRIVNNLKKNEFVYISVNHVFGNTAWINNLLVLQKLPDVGAFYTEMNLKDRLLGGGFAAIAKNKTICNLALEKGLLQLDDSKLARNDKTVRSNQEITITVPSKENNLIVIEQQAKQSSQVENSQNFPGRPEKESQLTAIADKQIRNLSKTIDEDVLTKRNSASMNMKSENWSKLEMNKMIEVKLVNEHNNGHWENVFLQITGGVEKQVYEQLQQIINHHVGMINAKQSSKRIFNSFSPLKNYIVYYNKLYHRAKLLGIYGGNQEQLLYRFFLCDIGSFVNLNSKDILMDMVYESTEEIVNFTPYQAVHCNLDGLNWSVSTKYYPITKPYLFVRALKKNDSRNFGILENLRINSYKVVLYEYDDPYDFKSGHMFNKILHDLGIIQEDWDSRAYIQTLHDSTTLSKFITDKTKDVAKDTNVLVFNAFMKCLYNNTCKINTINMTQSMLEKNKKENFGNTITNNIKSIFETTRMLLQHNDSKLYATNVSETSNISSSYATPCKTLAHTKTLPSLTNLHSRPEIIWYETDYLLHFTISVPCIEKYGVRVTTNSLHFVANVNGKTYVLILNLLGSVNPKQTSHEKSGRNVVVRLTKLTHTKWPRLLSDAVKLPCLTYDLVSIEAKKQPHNKVKMTAESTVKNCAKNSKDFLLLGI